MEIRKARNPTPRAWESLQEESSSRGVMQAVDAILEGVWPEQVARHQGYRSSFVAVNLPLVK